MKKYYLFFILTFLLTLTNYSKPVKETHHIIITLDRSRMMVGNHYTIDNVTIIKNLISSVFSYLQRPQSNGRALLQKGDFISFVGFGLHSPEYRYDDDFDNFIMIRDNLYQNLHGHFVDFGFRYKKVTSNNLNNIAHNLTNKISGGLFNKYWGVISISNQMTLHYLFSKNKLVHRTFIIVITDKEYNGESMDPIQELDRTKINYDNLSSSLSRTLNISKPLKICQLVKENYIWEPYPAQNPFKIKKRKVEANKYFYATCYEYIPLQKFFAIESCYRFDNRQAFFKRAYNGYSYRFKISDLNNPNYELLKLQAYIKTKKGNIEKKEISAIKDIDFVMPRSEYGKKDTLILKFYLHFKEKAYNASILYPEGGDLRGSRGLVRKIPIKFEPNAKISKIFKDVELTNDEYLAYAKKGADDQNLIVKKIEKKDKVVNAFILVGIVIISIIICLLIWRKNRNPVEL